MKAKRGYEELVQQLQEYLQAANLELSWRGGSRKKSKAEQFKEEFGEEGRYMVFDKLCIAEGGLNSHLAVERATSNAVECKRGHPFVQYHDW